MNGYEIFEESLDYVDSLYGYDISTEGRYFKKRIEKKQNMSDDEIRNTKYYQVCRDHLSKVNENELKNIKEKLAEGKRRVQKNTEEYLNQSTLKQLFNHTAIHTLIDASRSINAVKKGDYAPEKGYYQGHMVAAVIQDIKTIEVAVNDHERSLKKR